VREGQGGGVVQGAGAEVEVLAGDVPEDGAIIPTWRTAAGRLTPFGRPVVPDVYSMVVPLSASSRSESSSAARASS